MADIKTTEEIGLDLLKRKQAENATEVRPVEVSEEPIVDDEIDAELKTRVHEILSAGVLTNVDVAQVILADPESEKKDPFAKFQFRRKRQNYEQLKRSIKELGILEYMVLKKESGVDGVNRYYILDGHTRFNILLGLLKEDPTTLIPPFLVVECDDGDATLIADVLNSFSENLDGEDKPFAVIRMFEIGGVSQKNIAHRVGYSVSMVSEIIGAFLNVPLEAREMIESRKWTISHGIQLARLKNDEKEQLRVFENAKRYRYNADKLESTVRDSKKRRNYTKEAKDILKETLEGRESKTVTTADLSTIHAATLKQAYPYSTPAIAPKYTKEALQDLGYDVVEGEAEIEAVAAKPEKPKMPKNDELMEESYYRSVCPFCGGRTSMFIAEHFDFTTDTVYRPTSGIAHEFCELKVQIEEAQKQLEKTSIYKRIQEDSEGFTLEQMNEESHAIYNKELERRKQAWREEHLPDPKKLVKKGSKVGDPIEEKPKDQLKLFEKVRTKNPKLIPLHYWDVVEKHLNDEEGYKTQQEAANQIPVSVQSFYVQLKKVRTAIAALE
ncbi:MAG: hypothetical protein KGD60_14145 [Candidatus Thorarchaeota archaeon]|nr:hypothetical protein [Candidatus Thorarchaeota archaeon]